MPIKKDGTGHRWVEIEMLLPGSPEQVWQAIATGPGNTAWFTKAEIGEEAGGALRFDFGPMGSSAGEVTAWQPPQRFGYVERDWSEGAPPVATEITITSRAGGKCVLRMVHSLFSAVDDWDDQLESFESGWPAFFEILRVYLADFPGQEAGSFSAFAGVEGDPLAVWRDVVAKFCLGDQNVGADWQMPIGPEGLAGQVERVQQDKVQRYVLLRLTAPAPGLALIAAYARGGKINVSLSLYLYGPGAAAVAAGSEARWRPWLAAAFPAKPA